MRSLRLILYWDLLRSLAAKEIKVGYKRTSIGFLWAIINPLAQMVVLSIVFSYIVRIQVKNYPLFLLAGLLPWRFFSESVLGGIKSVTANADLIRKIYFPRELIPMANFLSSFFHFIANLLIFFCILLVMGLWPSWSWCFLPVIIGWQILFTLGFAFFFCAYNVFFGDIEFLMGFFLLLWFYLTPIFYPSTLIPLAYRPFFNLNPMAVIIEAYRVVLLEHTFPDAATMLYCTLCSVSMFVLGILIFWRKEHRFAEVL